MNVGLGRGRGVSRSLSPRIKDASAYTSASRSVPLAITEFRPPSPPRNPIRKFSHLSPPLSLSRMRCVHVCMCVCVRVRGSTTPTAYPIRSLGVSVRWNPDAERPAAAALAAFFARCEITRAPCGVSRVYLACVGGWTQLPIVEPSLTRSRVRALGGV